MLSETSMSTTKDTEEAGGGAAIHIISANAPGRNMTSDLPTSAVACTASISVICDCHSTLTGVLATSAPAVNSVVTNIKSTASAS